MADVLGAFEQAVLLAIVRLGDEAYGRAILKDVAGAPAPARRAGRRTRHADQARGPWPRRIASRHGHAQDRGGRARRYYRLLPKGLHSLNDARAAVNYLWQGIKWPLKGPA